MQSAVNVLNKNACNDRQLPHNIQVTTGKSRHQFNVVKRIFESLGTSILHSPIGNVPLKTASSNLVSVLILDNYCSAQEIKTIIQAKPLFHLLIVEPSVLNEYPELDNLAVELTFLPFNQQESIHRLQRSITALPTSNQRSTHAGFQEILIGNAKNFQNVIFLLERYSQIDAPVLINGETGTGKDLIAREVHCASERKDKPFQALNCGALADSILESELFGHVKGAFTDAAVHREGLIAEAEGGTLFLDEVDALTPKAQTMLLRFLENGCYRKVGQSKETVANVRIISATNKDLKQLVKQKLFRSDLMYRLNTLTLSLPSLRERECDILLLANHFLRKCESKFSMGKKVLHKSAQQELLSYDWPGNIRELEHFIQRVYLLTDGPVITYGPNTNLDEDLNPIATSSEKTSDSVDFELGVFAEAKKSVIDKFEQSYVKQLLEYTAGNVSRAAKIAGKERRVFGRLIKKHAIDKSAYIE